MTGITWWWIRHAPTHSTTLTGWRDVPADFSDQGALDRLERFLPFDAAVVASDLCRCSQTADKIASARPRLPDTEQLREIDFGVWDGLEFNEISKKWPELSREFWENPGDVSAPNGESWNLTQHRVARFVEEVNQSQRYKNVIAVAHFGVILTQVQLARQQTPHQALAQKIDNLSVTKLTFDGMWTEEFVNHST